MSEETKFNMLGFDFIGRNRSNGEIVVIILLNKNSKAVDWIRYVVEKDPLIYVINGREYTAEIYRYPGDKARVVSRPHVPGTSPQNLALAIILAMAATILEPTEY